MNRLLIILLFVFAGYATRAQKLEIGALGGIKSTGGWVTSLGYYHKVSKVQLGAIVEYSYIDKQYNFGTFNTLEYYAIAPGININVPLSIDKGYIYPGVALRYSTGNDGANVLRGMEYGFHMGIVYKLAGPLFLNVETGFRGNFINIYDAATKNGLGTAKSVIIPITAGLRVSF